MNGPSLSLPLSVSTPRKQHQSLKAMRSAVKDMQARLSAPRLNYSWNEDGNPLQASAGWRRRTIGTVPKSGGEGEWDEVDETEYRRGKIRETIRRDWDDESPSPPRSNVFHRKRFLHPRSCGVEQLALEHSMLGDGNGCSPLQGLGDARELELEAVAGTTAAAILRECEHLFGLIDEMKLDIDASKEQERKSFGHRATQTSEVEREEVRSEEVAVQEQDKILGDMQEMREAYEQLHVLLEHHEEQLMELQHAQHNFLNQIAQLQQQAESDKSRLLHAQEAMKVLLMLVDETCEEGLAISKSLHMDERADLQPPALLLCSTVEAALTVLRDMTEEQEELELTASRGLEMISFARRIHAQRLQVLSRMFCSWLAETRRAHARRLPFERLIRLPDIEIIHTGAGRDNQDGS